MNRRISYEVDMEDDFMNEDGRLYVPVAKELKPVIKEVAQKIEASGMRRMASVDNHFADDPELKRNGGPFDDHCMDRKYEQYNREGRFGVQLTKELGAHPFYIIENKIGEGDNYKRYTTDELTRIAEGTADILIEKQSYDVFTNPAVKPLLGLMGVQEALVYGVATDYCVKAAVLGMQEMGIQTYVIKDAITGITPDGSREAIDEMTKAGAKMIDMSELEEMLKE